MKEGLPTLDAVLTKVRWRETLTLDDISVICGVRSILCHYKVKTWQELDDALKKRIPNK